MRPLDQEARRDELAASLDEVRRRIGRACTAAGRDQGSVTLVAVTKTYPASDVALLAGLGVTDVGENKDQEAAAKAAAVAAPLRWHFVGQLQRNKAKSVVTYADVVESVDSTRLAAALSSAATRLRERPLDVLVQVSIDGDPDRGGAITDGADPDRDLWRVAAAVDQAEGLRLSGVMAVAPLGWEPERAFATLAALADRLRAGQPAATVVSAGMSGDLEQAVRHGATHVRIGTSLLGMRNTLR
ncbi:YggS family pyridoxal phosphate-dependent enzyme [Actinoplanes sp. ATCC 53533]|uniref:YggS family pyridoxal phosphate-dependent enzyme n=1 Tax=Actinoplanes sp. ATCC 53533 TaxID=1288362 RepID=UPI000F79376B|nr:YggS family pyridoxal phosphate-dependent enzyme [Actinoplanes sp. ATCC 53533]RSM72872.1 YggS family pyridoxal phosphate-dependent enzyme [Actinoplanes sp. ATCC 53533]